MVWRRRPRVNLAARPLDSPSLGADLDAWLDVVEHPLPETLRITPHRQDAAWTVTNQGHRRRTDALDQPPSGLHHALPARSCRRRGAGLISHLHQSGRITRRPRPCSPWRCCPWTTSTSWSISACSGSKTTQVAELHPLTTVIANEPVSGRVNTLVSNRAAFRCQRARRATRRSPFPNARSGVDAVIADLPCTGSNTMRKNREVWWS